MDTVIPMSAVDVAESAGAGVVEVVCRADEACDVAVAVSKDECTVLFNRNMLLKAVR